MHDVLYVANEVALPDRDHSGVLQWHSNAIRLVYTGARATSSPSGQIRRGRGHADGTVETASHRYQGRAAVPVDWGDSSPLAGLSGPAAGRGARAPGNRRDCPERGHIHGPLVQASRSLTAQGIALYSMIRGVAQSGSAQRLGR